MSTAITFENISKLYRLGTIGTGTISHDLNRWWHKVRGKEDPYLKVGAENDRSVKADSDYVWALKNITFDVEQGDVIGIIGKNGAGKSTLLKILSRVTRPTTGLIRAKGRIASLLEVGTGFHPEMTGRENIYMNGAIMGMTKSEITRKLDEIIAFAGVEKYIDTPAKRYSSGMTVRLGFAIAAHLEPEILVVDEVLAVGDAEFQKKAIGKMQDVSKGEGRTILFVSHNMGAVRNLCQTGVVLKNGMVDFIGHVNEAIDYYMQLNVADDITFKLVDNSVRLPNSSLDAQFLSVGFLKEKNSFSTNEDIELIFEIKGNKDIEDLRINSAIQSIDDTPIGNSSGTPCFSLKKGETKKIVYTLSNHALALGDYYISFSLGIGDFISGQKDFDTVWRVLSFKIDQYSENACKGFLQWNKEWGHVVFQSKLQEYDR